MVPLATVALVLPIEGRGRSLLKREVNAARDRPTSRVQEAMGPKPGVEDLLAKAYKPEEEALRLHPVYRSRVEATPKCRITGLADFANQVNIALAFPAISRAGLDVEATKITDEMCMAPKSWPRVPSKNGSQKSTSSPDGWDVSPREAVAVGLKAIELGITRRAMTQEALLENAAILMNRAPETTRTLTEYGIIPLASYIPTVVR
jgi:hypothetical protein